VRRTIFTDEHEQFRQTVRAFLEKECVPHTTEWLEAGVVSWEAWRKAGELFAVYAIAHADRAFLVTREYARDRHAFGRPIGEFQVNRFALAEMKTKLDVAHAYLDRCVQAALDGELTAEEAAEAKWWATELQWEIVDRCLQLHGGYGYINEYEIARLWRDARVQRLYGGTTEIMKEIVGRSLGF
jgi:alkylation response protein AidB-like acyl-CoA dehydrogenase